MEANSASQMYEFPAEDQPHTDMTAAENILYMMVSSNPTNACTRPILSHLKYVLRN